MATEAANLFVKVTGDISDATQKLGQIGQTATKTGGILRGAVGTALGFGAASIGLSAMGSAMDTVQSGVIGMNASLETSTLQFTTLMGSSKKAEDQVQMLFDFAAKTPFETGPIMQASRTMQTFGGDALNTKANLTLFGDAAAAVSQPIDDVSFWMSRAYAAIKGGQPFGEARMRLMEMGVVAPQTAAKIDALTKKFDTQIAAAVKMGDKTKAASLEQQKQKALWGEMTGALGKFGGAMDKQSQTFDGMMSTFSDSMKMMLATAGKPIFDFMKGLLTNINSLMASPAFQGALSSVAAGIGKALGFMGEAMGKVADFISPIVSGFASAAPVVDGVLTSFTGITNAAGGMGTTISILGSTIMTGLMSAWSTVETTLTTWTTQLGTWVLDALPGLIVNLQTFAQGMFDWIINTGVPMLATTVGTMADTMVNWITTTALPKLAVLLPQIGTAILDFISTNGPMLLQKLVEWGQAFVGWIIPRIPGLLAAIGQFVGSLGGWIINTGIPRILGMAGDLGTSLINGFLQFVIGPPGLLERIGTFISGTLIPGIIKYGPGLLKAAGDIAGGFVKGFIDFMGSLPGKIADVIRKAFGSIKIDIGPFHISANGVTIDLPDIKLPGFATGSWSVPSTGPALIHKGEMIIPADLASRLRGGSGFGGGSALSPGGYGGGGQVIVINIGDFHGTQENIKQLSQQLGEVVRYGTIRRSAVGA